MPLGFAFSSGPNIVVRGRRSHCLALRGCDPARSQTSSTMDTTGLYSSERFNNSYRTTTLESTAMPGIKWSDKRFQVCNDCL